MMQLDASSRRPALAGRPRVHGTVRRGGEEGDRLLRALEKLVAAAAALRFHHPGRLQCLFSPFFHHFSSSLWRFRPLSPHFQAVVEAFCSYLAGISRL